MIKINIENYIEAIVSIDLFNSFSKDDLIQQFSPYHYKIKKYDKGQMIHIQNELCESMDLILKGTLSVQKIDEEGKILKVAVFSGGDILGANLLFSNSNSYPMTIVAESETVILHINKELVLELCQKNTVFMTNLLTVISNKTVVLTDKIDTISLKTIRQKITDFLKYEYHIQKSTIIKLNISKKDLAERLGIQRTSLSRELNKMRKDGLIDYDFKTIRIKEKNLL